MSGMTNVQANRLDALIAGTRQLHKQLDDRFTKEWDGNDPDLTLALEVSALGTALADLELTKDHHDKEFL